MPLFYHDNRPDDDVNYHSGGLELTDDKIAPYIQTLSNKTEVEVTKDLQHIFGLRNPRQPKLSEEEQLYVVAALRIFPDLAKEHLQPLRLPPGKAGPLKQRCGEEGPFEKKYRYMGDDKSSLASKFPFLSLLLCGSEVSVLKEVYYLFRGVLGDSEEQIGYSEYPLIWACKWRNDEADLIQFLMEENPKAAIGPRHYAFLVAARYGAPRKTLLALLEPTMAQLDKDRRYGCSSDEMPDMFSLVCSKFRDGELLEFVRDHILATRSKFYLNFRRAVHIWQARALDKLMPYLTELTFNQGGITEQAIHHFLRSVSFNKTLRKLKLSCDVFQVNGDDSGYGAHICTAFGLIIKNNNVLESFDIRAQHEDHDRAFYRGEDGREEYYDSIVENILGNMKHNKVLKELSLSNFFLSNMSLLHRLLATPNLEKISLAHVHVMESEESLTSSTTALPLCQLPTKRSTLRDVALNDCEWLSGCILPIVDMLSNLPLLERLSMQSILDSYESYTKEDDLTDGICRLLEKGRLGSLALQKDNVDRERVLKSLRTNATLVSYRDDDFTEYDGQAFVELLSKHNMTLEELNFLSRIPLNEDEKNKVAFFTALNSYGRKEASSGLLSAAEFVELLCAPISNVGGAVCISDDSASSLPESKEDGETGQQSRQDSSAKACPTAGGSIFDSMSKKKRKRTGSDCGVNSSGVKKRKHDESATSDSDSLVSAVPTEMSDETFFWDDDDEPNHLYLDLYPSSFMRRTDSVPVPLIHPLLPLNIHYGLLMINPGIIGLAGGTRAESPVK